MVGRSLRLMSAHRDCKASCTSDIQLLFKEIRLCPPRELRPYLRA